MGGGRIILDKKLKDYLFPIEIPEEHKKSWDNFKTNILPFQIEVLEEWWHYYNQLEETIIIHQYQTMIWGMIMKIHHY